MQNLLEGFDAEFRTATVLAQAVARKVGSPEIGHHHLIVGLLAEPAGLASKLLVAVDADIDTLTRELRALLGPINPSPDRPRLGRDAGEAIQTAQRLPLTSDEATNTAHLLIALTTPLSGRGRTALKRAGVTKRAVKTAYKSGIMSVNPGLDAASVEWVWDYLPQAGRLMRAGEKAQAAGDLPRAIASYHEALTAAKEDDLTPGTLGDIYPRLIQACLLVGDLEAAIHWLDEADQYVENYRSRSAPNPPKMLGLMSGIEELIAAHVQDMRLQLLKDRAQIYLGQDEFGMLESTARTLIDAADELNHPAGVAAGRNLLGLALAYKGGADDEAKRNLQASLEPAELIEPVDVASRTYSLAVLALLRGDPSEARRSASMAQALYGDLGLQRSVTVTRLAKAEAVVATGDGMPPGLLQEVEMVDPDGRAQLLGWALRLDARSKRSSDAPGALSTIEQAIVMSRQNNQSLVLVRCLLEQGRILRMLRDLSGATAAFEEALRLSEALEVRFAMDAQRELDALGTELP